MSYILGALRKAEQESKRRSKSDEDPWDSADWNAPQPSSGATRGFKIVVVVAIALFLAVFVLIWLMLGKLSEPSDSAFSGSSLNDRASTNIQEMAPSPPVESGAETPTPVFQSELPSEPRFESTIQDEEVELPIITGHLYFPANETLSRLFGETGSYRVGHVFENGLRLVSITEVEAVFEKEGDRYEMPLDN